MKRNILYALPIAASLSLLSSCDKKPKQEISDAAEALSSKVEEVIESVTSSVVSPLDDSVKLGFAEHLPSDVELLMEVYDIKGAFDRMLATKVGGVIQEVMASEDMPIDQMLEDSNFQMAMDILGEEVFLATGKGSSAQFAGLMGAYNQISMDQLESVMSELVLMAGESSEKHDGELSPASYLETPEGKAFCDSIAVVPTYLGVKVSDAEKRSSFMDMIQAMIAKSLEDEKDTLTPITKEINGVEFKGAQISGTILAKLLRDDSYEEMVNTVGENAADTVIAAIETKNLVGLAGTVGDYIVIFMGGSVDELVFAESKSQSFLAREDAAYLGNHAGDDVMAVAHASKELMAAMSLQSGTLASMINAVKPSLKEAGFTSSEKFVASLEKVISSEKAYYGMMKPYRMGVVAHVDDGFKVNSYAGETAPFFDVKTKRQFASLEDKLDPVFFANWVGDSEDSKILLDYVEAIGVACYEGATVASKIVAEGGEMAQFSATFGMFNSMAKDDTLAIWNALAHDLAEGLGNEGAVLVDLKGEMPTVPMIPEPLLKMAAPRIASINDVQDRAKLATSWENLNTAVENLLKIGSQMTGNNIPMQKPSKSRADGLTTWSFPIPMTTDNCKPCLSVSDDIFIMSSSPDFSEKIATAVGGPAGAPGSYATLNFDAAFAYAGDWLEMLNKNADTLMGVSGAAEFREEAYPWIVKLLEAANEYEEITVKTHSVNGEVQSEVHFNMR